MSATMSAAGFDAVHPAKISAWCRTWARETECDISAKAKQLLGYMADLVDWRRPTPSAFACVDTYAGWLGLKRRATQYALRELEEARLIVPAGKHRGRTTRYRLAFDPLAGMHPRGAPPCTPEAAKGAPPCTQTLNFKKEHCRDSSESAREPAPPMVFHFHQEAQPVPSAQPDPDPAPPESPATAEAAADLTTWRPDEAGVALALARGATDIAAELATFLACHERRGTALQRLSSRWRSWCERIPTFGPNGRRDAPRSLKPAARVQQPLTIDAEAPDGADQHPENFPECDAIGGGPTVITDIALPAAAASAPWQTDADAAVRRVSALWEMGRHPVGFVRELRDAFARYPAPVLDRAIDQVRDQVRYPTITVADFTTRADAMMTALAFLDPRHQQAERQREVNEAARCAAEEAKKAEAAVRVREQREAEAEAEGACILTRHGV
jgi:hypothetical protein